MAEEKHGQATNPPQEQPNEALPRSYEQRSSRKTSWPELVGESAEEAEKKIKEEKSEVEIQVVPPGYLVTADFKPQRVRLYVDGSNKITRTPGIG
ncbi:subtilisin inhibitor CLSI-I-like [Abrus precatorius]|uniref:Subtilisin inhibitor CLSI-I-like n=1 Tax=Abrus precatorius TaxID=3816 RepID=A0A8B8KK13_ABRPR|nr:subtilisin inhibitor CLSI-I-like [Abrus precatorius]